MDRMSWDALCRERNETVAYDWLHSADTYAVVGERYGITRERVRQVINKVLPKDVIEERKKEPGRIRQEIKMLSRPIVECVICEKQVYQRGRGRYRHQTCCPEHSVWWRSIRWHTPEYREIHRTFVAEWAIRNPDKATKEQLNFAYRFLEGTAGYHGRWFKPGSASHQCATAAYLNQWPIFDRLLPELQIQIRREQSDLRRVQLDRETTI